MAARVRVRAAAGHVRWLLPPLLALTAFAAVASLLRPLVPWTEGYGIAARMRHLAEHRGDYDLLFLGSSTIRNGVWPARFDARLAARGHSVRSFNLGAGAVNGYEMTFMLERVLALDPPRLRWVVMELLPWDPRTLIGRNRFTDRVVFWHSPAVTLDVLAVLARWPLPARVRVELGGLHLAHAAWRFASLGRGGDAAAALLGVDSDRDAEDAHVADWRGFEAPDRNLNPRREQARARFLRELPGWRARIRRIDAENTSAQGMARTAAARRVTSEIDLRLLRRQVALVRERGARPLFVVPPVAAATPVIYALDEEGLLPDLLAYNQPLRHPALYREENRFDATHLNERGAIAFSLLLADDFADWLER
jgi:hypothetical protein